MEKLMRKMSQKIPYWVYNLLSLLSAIATLITFLYTIYDVICNKVGSKTYFFAVLILVIGLSVMAIRIRKYGELLIRIKTTYSREYNLFLQAVKDHQFKMMKLHKNIEESNNRAWMEALTEMTYSFSKDSLGRLCKIFEAITGKEISACIKLIVDPNTKTYLDSINYEEAEIKTFCRSECSDVNRKSRINDCYKVKDNTDFYSILKNNSDNNLGYFYQENLVEYDKRMRGTPNEYRNTTLHYEDYYQSTIVVPIMTDKKHTHFFKESTGYDILGFLCVDSLATDIFRNTEVDKNVFVNLIQSFAESFYLVLNQYRYYMNMGDIGKND